jgi:hypothetical protein
VSDFDWDRKGPPRPGSGSVDHPRGIERPYVHVTDADRAKKSKAYREEAKARGRAIVAAEWEARFGTPYPLRHLM